MILLYSFVLRTDRRRRFAYHARVPTGVSPFVFKSKTSVARLQSAGGRAAAAAAVTQIEADRNEREAPEDDDRVELREELQPGQPLRVAQTERLERAPETVRDVIVDRGEPNDIQHAYAGAAKRLHDQLIGIRFLRSEPRRELHLGPEVEEVKEQEENDDHAENKHVLRRPRGRLRFVRDGVTHVARAARPVFELDEHREKDMNDKTAGKDGNHDLNQDIFVHEHAYRVIGALGKERR